MRTFFILLLIASSSWLLRAASPPEKAVIHLAFYSAELSFDLHPQAFDHRLLHHEPRDIKHFLWALDQGRLHTLLHGLQTAKALLRLNDWLFLKLCRKALKKSYPDLSRAEQQAALCWMMARSGYDARLVYDESGVEMIVRCGEKVYNATSVFLHRGGEGYLLPSSVGGQRQKNQLQYYLDYAPNPRGRALSFVFDSWPLLPSDTIRQTFQFTFEQADYRLHLHLPTGLRALLFDYPVVESGMYWQTPMSPYLRDQLTGQLAPLLAERSDRDALRLLLAFTRQAFSYRTDDTAYGFEKPFFAEEVFLHPHSDCEDRVALFYNLVRELLGFPMLVLEMPDHLTLAVAFAGGSGQYIRHRGQTYWLCDPTGPVSPNGSPILAPAYDSDDFRLLDSSR